MVQLKVYSLMSLTYVYTMKLSPQPREGTYPSPSKVFLTLYNFALRLPAVPHLLSVTIR